MKFPLQVLKRDGQWGWLLPLLLLLLLLGSGRVWGQVSLTASAGTGTGNFTNLAGAFTAINAGTHKGVIKISLTANVTEANDGAVLQASGQGSTSYTSILIQPTVDNVTLAPTASTANSNGVILLLGASNVTIDGDNPNSAGTNQNLTIKNTAGTTAQGTTVIRVAGLASPLTATTASNNIIRNCILTGNGTGGTGNSSATNTTYGIYAGTDATALGSQGSGISSSGTGKYANLTVSNNLITTCARPFYVSGTASVPATGVAVSNNTMGSAAAGNISAVGIYTANATSPSITGNTVRNLTSVQTTVSAGSGSGIFLDAGTASARTLFTNSVHELCSRTLFTNSVHELCS